MNPPALFGRLIRRQVADDNLQPCGKAHTPGAGTIGYEILTSLGSRYHRVYTGGGA